MAGPMAVAELPDLAGREGAVPIPKRLKGLDEGDVYLFTDCFQDCVLMSLDPPKACLRPLSAGSAPPRCATPPPSGSQSPTLQSLGYRVSEHATVDGCGT